MKIGKRLFLILAAAVLMITALPAMPGAGSALALTDTATTKESGPLTTHTPRTYTWDLNENYPLPLGNYSNYLQSLGILYPGDKVVIVPEKDENMGDGYQGCAGIRFTAEKEGTTPVVGTKIGPFEVTRVAVNSDYTFILEVKVLSPAMLQEAGGGDAVRDGTNTYRVRTVRYIEIPKYIPVQYIYNLAGVGNVESVDGELYGHENPTVIWAEDLCLSWNREKRDYELIGPCFKIYRPFIEGYSFMGWDYESRDIPMNVDRNNGEELREYGQKDGKEFYFTGWQCNFSTSFPNAMIGSETTPVKIYMRYEQRYSYPETLALQGNGGTILGYKSRRIDLEPYDGFWSLDAFPEDFLPVQKGKIFTGWYKDSKCTEVVASADLTGSEMMDAIKSDYRGRSSTDEGWHYNLYAGWKTPVVDEVTSGGAVYTLDHNKTTASLKSLSDKKAAALTIPAAVKANGKSYKVTAVASGAAKGAAKLAEVTIGKNVKTVGKNAFNGCKVLKTVKGAAGVTSLGDSAFAGCVKLKTVPAMAKLQTVGAAAFQNCKALASVTLGTAVKKIGKNAFNGCKALKTITLKTTRLTEKTVGAGAFKGIYSKAAVKCPSAKKAAYKTLLVKKGAPKTAKFK